MPRIPNHIPTVQITLSTTPPLKKHLEKLVATGLYGKNAAEAADRLLGREVERLIKEGVLRK